MAGRQSKKSEKIELRVSHELKEELKEQSSQHGQTLSSYVRNLVTEGHADRSVMESRRLYLILPAIGLIALGVAAPFFWSSTSAGSANFVRALFAMYDNDLDGAITKSEFDAAHAVDVADVQLPPSGVDVPIPPECFEKISLVMSEVEEGSTVDVDRTELRAEDYQSFEALDINSDGEIVFDEFDEALKEQFKFEFSRLDKDQDKKLSPEEFATLAFILDPAYTTPAAMSGFESACLAPLDQAVAVHAQESKNAVFIQSRMEFASIDKNRDRSISFTEYMNQ